MSSSDIAISVRGLGKSYTIRHNATSHTTLAESMMHRLRNPFARTSGESETFWALKDVSFDIKKGDVVGIIGRNGAGKSTLLKVLSRITEPTEGEVDLYGRVGSLLEVGTGFHQELTGRENIFLNGAILGMSRNEIKSQFDAIVDFAGVEQFLDTPVKRYSSGMYVRLAFAVAAHLRSEILIVDEVLSVGDAEFQKKCLGKMRQVATDGRTVLFVSHDITAIEKLTDRCIAMERGRVKDFDTTRRVTEDYLGEYEFAPRKRLEDWELRRGVGPQKLLGLEAQNARGAVTRVFRPGDPITISIRILSPKRFRFDVAIAVENSSSQALFATHLSDHNNLELHDGIVQLNVEIVPAHLRVGTYLLSAGIYSPDFRTVFDEVQHFPMFEINGRTAGFPDDGRWGSLYFALEWRQTIERAAGATRV